MILYNPLAIRLILSAILYSIPAGIIGSYIAFKDISGITGSISHAILGGISIGVILKSSSYISILSPISCGIIFSILCAYIITLTSMHNREREDSISVALWVLGVSITVLCQTTFPYHSQEISKYIFGNIFWICKKDLMYLLLFDLVTVVTVATLHKQITMICIDEKVAHVQGINVRLIHFILLSLITINITFLTLTVGSLMVISFLNIPSITSIKLCRSINASIAAATILNLLSALIGITVSFYYNIPPSVTTSLILVLTYLLSMVNFRGT